MKHYKQNGNSEANFDFFTLWLIKITSSERRFEFSPFFEGIKLLTVTAGVFTPCHVLNSCVSSEELSKVLLADNFVLSVLKISGDYRRIGPELLIKKKPKTKPPKTPFRNMLHWKISCPSAFTCGEAGHLSDFLFLLYLIQGRVKGVNIIK